MTIPREELQALLRLIELTKAEEIDCDEFLVQVSPYLERVVKGGEVCTEQYAAVAHHLKVCPECLEEFDSLVAALRDGV